jgi:hypothetical protein
MDTLYLVFKDRFFFISNPYLVAYELFSVAPQTIIFRLKQTATLSDCVQLVKRVSLRRLQLFSSCFFQTTFSTFCGDETTALSQTL